MAEPVCNVQSNDVYAAVALQLEGVELQIHSSKAKYLENEPPDSELSFLVYRTELTNLLASLKDERIARNIAKATEGDATVIDQIVAQEQLARTDRAWVLTHEVTCEDSEVDYLEAFEAKEPDGQQQHDCPSLPGTPSNDESASRPSSLLLTQQSAAFEPWPPGRCTRCLACQEVFRPHKLIRCPCDHIFAQVA